MKTILLTIVFMTGMAQANGLIPSQTEAQIKGPEATKIANMMISHANRNAVYAKGTANFSCTKGNRQTDFTCNVKVVPK